MSVQAMYQQKRMSANDAIRQVKNGDTIVVPTAVGEPPTLLTAPFRAAPTSATSRWPRSWRCANTAISIPKP